MSGRAEPVSGDVIDDVADRLTVPFARDAGIGARTTYRVGGRAALLVEADSTDDLAAIAAAIDGRIIPTLVVGKGSNLLVSDAGFAGVAIVLGESFADIEIGEADADELVRVEAGGAAFLPVVARRTVAAGLTGFEWAVGVPGSIGGAARMNAGGHGSDMAASLTGIHVFDLHSSDNGWVSPEQLSFGYRRSSVASNQLVTSVRLGLAPSSDPQRSSDELSEIVRWRRANQPGGQNAGSVFTNPPGDSAGRLIDAAGCKGLRVGTAEVSTKHANFIQADVDGSADDIVALMLEIVSRVEGDAGVRLHPETRLVGFDDTRFEKTGTPPNPATT